MSDALKQVLQAPADWKPAKSEDPDQRLIDALDKALKATTPERAGCPWDVVEEENERPEYWRLPEGD